MRRLNWTMTINPRLDTSPENYHKWGTDRTSVTPENVGKKVHLRVEMQAFRASELERHPVLDPCYLITSNSSSRCRSGRAAFPACSAPFHRKSPATKASAAIATRPSISCQGMMMVLRPQWAALRTKLKSVNWNQVRNFRTAHSSYRTHGEKKKSAAQKMNIPHLPRQSIFNDRHGALRSDLGRRGTTCLTRSSTRPTPMKRSRRFAIAQVSSMFPCSK